VTEKQLQQAVIECAHLFGWRVAHFRPAWTEKGWRTPVEADGAGWPDLVLVRKYRLIFVELKTEKGKLSVAQEAWMEALRPLAQHEVYVWRPSSWTGGQIEACLR